MEIESMFKNAGDPWSQEEDKQLNKLYNIDMLTVMEISNIHNRAPGGIISRLVKNMYIPNRVSARGYLEYKSSDLYKEIVRNSNERKKERINSLKDEKKITSKTNSKNKLDNILISINQNDYNELKTELTQVNTELTDIKKEIKDMKSSISELIDMMKAVYEFEDA